MVAGTGEAPREKTGNVRWSRLPILLTTALLGFAALFALIVRASEPLAISPWESAIAMEAMRAKAGLPLYDQTHATHLYGPLLTLALAAIFSATGLNLLAARVVFSIAGIALAALCTVLVCRGSRRKYMLLVFVMFTAIGWRTNFISFCAQPDAIAALCGVLALTLWAKGLELLSIPLFITAVFFKQTAAAFALIPIVCAILLAPDRSLKILSRGCWPAAAVVLALTLVRFTAPLMFHAMIVVPGSIVIHWERTLPSVLLFFGSFPILFLALQTFSRRTVRPGVESWIIAAAVVLVPLSIWTMLKSGGGYSSLFPAYLALVALVAIRIEDLISTRSGMKNLIVASALLVSFFFPLEKALPLLFNRSADGHYASVVAVAKRLEGNIVSPQDPSIAYRAKGTFGPSLFFELDTNSVNGEWPRVMPANIETALRSANYVIEAESYVPVAQFQPALVAAGFRKINVPELANSAYAVWEK